MKQVWILALALLPGWLAAQAVIAGQVTDESGEPLAGASVLILETKKGTSTNENGLYRLENLPPGTYTLRVSYLGYEDEIRKTNIPEGFEQGIVHVQMTRRIVELSDVVVRATRATGKAPFTRSNLDKEVLESENLGQDVPFLLRWTPSAVVTSDAGAGVGYTGIRIRGTDPTRINVTINGNPLNDAESPAVFWVDLPDFASSTESIQIQRGVGTSTNGAGAFGATISLNTTGIHEKPYAEINGSAGSFDTRKVNVKFGSGLLGDHFTLDGRVSRIHSDGYIDRATSDLSAYYFSAGYATEKQTLHFNVFSGSEVTYQAWNGVPAQYVNDEKLRRFNVSGTEKPGDPYENEVDDYTQTHYQILYNARLNRNFDLNLGGHYTRGKGFFEQYKGGERFSDYGLSPIDAGEVRFETGTPLEDILNTILDDRIGVAVDTVSGAQPWLRARYFYERTDLVRRRWLDNDFYGATWALNYLRNDNRFRLTFGGAWNQYKGDHFGQIIWSELLPAGTEPAHQYYSGTGDKTDFNAFLKTGLDFDSGLSAFLDLQFRRVDYAITGTDNDLRDVTNDDQLNFFNPKVGLFYTLNPSSGIYASFAVGNREPNRDDYTDSPTGQKPRPETLYNTEIGWRQNRENATFEANFYHMLYKDQLVLTGQINDVGSAIRVNVPDSYRMGVELSGAVRWAKNWAFSGNLALSQNKIQNFVEYRDNWDTGGQDRIEHGETDIAFSPNVIAAGALSYALFRDKVTREDKALEVTLMGKYVSKQYIDNTSNENTVLDPWFYSDLKIEYLFKTPFAREMCLKLLARNIFDARYSTNAWTYRFNASFPGPIDGNPYGREEGDGTYNLTGFYPQAGINFLAGLTVTF
ncbi:MAG: TonB-dependent receptor [Bacteroidetes bacterium]|nr:MAG: TonB-dependent receptor [Bacteroidota bacterium]